MRAQLHPPGNPTAEYELVGRTTVNDIISTQKAADDASVSP